MQYVGLCVFSLPIFLLNGRDDVCLHLITIKLEIWIISHCVGLGHESMVCAVSCYVILIKPMMTSPNGNIFRFTDHMCREFTAPRWIPHTKASDADVFSDLRPNKLLSKQWWGWWFETPSCQLWRHRNAPQLISTVAGDYKVVNVTTFPFQCFSIMELYVFFAYLLTPNTLIDTKLVHDGSSVN